MRPDMPFLNYNFDAEDWVMFYAQSILPPESDAFDHIICCAATRFSKPESKCYVEVSRKYG
jgi:FMN phosphatase YigB (HAD superfamily)